MKVINLTIEVYDDVDEQYVEYAIHKYAEREGWYEGCS